MSRLHNGFWAWLIVALFLFVACDNDSGGGDTDADGDSVDIMELESSGEMMDEPEEEEGTPSDGDEEDSEMEWLCEDGPCCRGGVLVEAGAPCLSGEDELACTRDFCDASGECVAELSEGFCLIDESCYETGALNPENACEVCKPEMAAHEWSELECGPGGFCEHVTCDSVEGCISSSIECDDMIDCTEDRCDETIGCVFEANHDYCADTVECTLDQCDETLGCVNEPLDQVCADEFECTLDSCDTEEGCVNLPDDTICADEIGCTIDRCDAEFGCMNTPDPMLCDDGVACTEEICDIAFGCLHEPKNALCDDEIPCTLDSCDEEDGCIHQAQDEACDDAIGCTNDICSLTEGCLHDAEDTLCDDGHACTTDRCDASLDCVHTPDNEVCDDEIACTTDRCDREMGCVNTAQNSHCDDGLQCTVDFCDETEGCLNTPENERCDDDITCTVDRCDSQFGCTNTPDNEACRDAFDCTNERCDREEGCIVTPDDADCDDAIACTADHCDLEAGCVNTPEDGECEDNVECTVNTCSTESGCVFTPDNQRCDDAVACTDDTCDANLGCWHTLNHDRCADEISCTIDRCDAENGCQNTPDATLCNDHVSCTVDTCDAQSDCRHDASACECTENADCNDQIACTIDTCNDQLVCEYDKSACECRTDSDCNDSVPCTRDACNDQFICEHTPNDTQCDDSIGCTEDSCHPTNGCQHTPDNSACNDNLACSSDACNPSSGCEHDYAGCECEFNGDCSDSVYCTSDQCKSDHTCAHYEMDSLCDDGVSCTIDRCDEESGCSNTPNNSACEDSIACTVDTCDASGGCLHDMSGCECAEDSDCADAIDCTNDYCDDQYICRNTTVHTNCNDNVGCTVDVCDADSGCSNTPDNARCNDDIACSVNTCHLTNDCQLDISGCECDEDADCADAVDCTSDQCNDEYACENTPVHGACNDDVACTDDVCDVDSGCSNTANDDHCADGIDCTANTCHLTNGCQLDLTSCECEVDSDCDDSSFCTNDSCNTNLYECVFTSGADDAQEENDSKAHAVSVAAGDTLNVLAVNANDEDWFKTDVCAEGVLTITASFTHADGNLDLTLVDENGDTLESATSGSDNETITWTADVDQTVYWKAVLVDQEGCIDYSMAVVLDASQCCPAPLGSLSCDNFTAANTKGLDNLYTNYSCYEDDDEMKGGEALYTYDATCDGWATAKVTMNSDADLYTFVLEDCDAATCMVAYGEYVGSGLTTELPFRVLQGERYFIIVDSRLDEGGLFKLELIDCDCTTCTDSDEDGYFAYHHHECPEGDDCADDNDSIHPGASEIECDGIDQDCSDGDLCQELVCADEDEDGYFRYDPQSCPQGNDCNDDRDDINPGAAEVNCDDVDQNCDGLDWCPGTGQQCDACMFGEGCGHNHECLPNFENFFEWFCVRNCAADGLCPVGSTCIGEGDFQLCYPDTTASCDGDTLMQSDSCGNDLGFTECPSATCNNEAGVCEMACPATTNTIACGGSVTGHTGEGENVADQYSCPYTYDYNGKELIYEYTAQCDGHALALLEIDSDASLDVIILDDPCSNASCIERSRNDGRLQEVRFETTNGESYFLAVDGEASDEGRFTLSVECYCAADEKAHCQPCTHDLDCQSEHCYAYNLQHGDARVCVDDCSVDASCPAGSSCTPTDDDYLCLPSFNGACDGQTLSINDTCGNSFELVTCEAGDTCDASGIECDSACVDDDEDDHYVYDPTVCPEGDDCDDTNAAIHPGADDIRCNGVDEDCSGCDEHGLNCSGGDNCSERTQCEECEAGHCAEGHHCMSWPGDDYAFCVMEDCLDPGCPDESQGGDPWDLACYGVYGSGYFWCKPELAGECVDGNYRTTDGCGHLVSDIECDFGCYDDFGCVNNCGIDSVEIAACDSTVHGDTGGGTVLTTYYYNTERTIDDLIGPEINYYYTAQCDGELTAHLEAEDWLYLFAFEENFAEECRSSRMLDYASHGNSLTILVETGVDYFFVIDGMDGEMGEFDLSISCFCSSCQDSDSDNYDGYHPVDCPEGRDCDDTNDAIYPGASEPDDCDGVDQDCDGYDNCSTCNTDVVLNACDGSEISGDTRGQANDVTFYKGECAYSGENYAIKGGEMVYEYTAQCDGHLTAVMSDFDEDMSPLLYVLEEACDVADHCVMRSNWDTVETDVVTGETYYIVVDSYEAQGMSFSLSVDCECYDCTDNDSDTFYAYDAVDCPTGTDCNDNDAAINPDATDPDDCDGVDQNCNGYDDCTTPTCSQTATIACDSGTITGDTSGQTNQMTLYPEGCGEFVASGGEDIYAFTATCDGYVVAELTFNWEEAYLWMMVLEENCEAQSCIGYGGYWTTSVVAGDTLYYVVESDAGEEGEYELMLDCICN